MVNVEQNRKIDVWHLPTLATGKKKYASFAFVSTNHFDSHMRREMS